ncbi:hypothetical protein GOODEAATRI_015364, partial [Goodea atripinnis]
MSARDIAQTLKSLASAARGVAATTDDAATRNAVLDCAGDVMDKSANLIEETKRAIAKPGDAESQQRLAQVAKAVSQALNRCVNSLPGQRDVDNAIRTVGEASRSLLADSAQLNEVAAGLNQSANEVVQASRGTTQDLARATSKFGQDFSNFLGAGVDMAGTSKVVSNLKTISMSSSKLLLAAKALSTDPSSPNLKNQLAAAARAVTDSINQLITMCTQQAPGQKECDNALRELEVLSAATIVAKHTSALCNACRLASSKTPNPVAKRQFVQSAKEVANTTANLVKSIKVYGAFNQENREKCKAATGPLMEAVDNLAAFASNPEFASIPAQISPEGHAAMEPILTAAQMILESSTGLIQTARSLAVNPKDPPKWSVLAGHSRTVSDSIKKLITNMRYASLMASYFEPLIMAAIGTASKILSSQQQMAVLDQTKTLAESALQMLYTAKEAGGNPKAAYMQNALEDSVQMMKEAVDDLGATLGEAASAAGAVGGMVDSINHAINKMEDGPADEPDGTFVDYQTTMVKTAKAIAVTVQEMVSHVLASLQAGNRGTQACITAASAVAGIIADLDTTIMFATAGTLNRENAETFADHREYILKTAKALVEDTKLLVSGAGASQERLAQAAQSSVSTITKLADVVKLGAASLGSEDPETQVVLINAVKDVAKALGNLISATKAAAGKPHDDPSMLQLKSSAKVMVTNVTSLLKTVKAVEDEATKGTRALEATIEHIKQELTEDIIATANLSRRAIADMLHSCK